MCAPTNWYEGKVTLTARERVTSGAFAVADDGVAAGEVAPGGVDVVDDQQANAPGVAGQCGGLRQPRGLIVAVVFADHS